MVSNMHKREFFKQMLREHSNCIYCGIRMLNDPRFVCDFSVTIDHMVPKSKGGRNLQNNIVLSCWLCNNVKDANDFIDFSMFALWNIKPYRHDLTTLATKVARINTKRAIAIFKLSIEGRIVSTNDKEFDARSYIKDFLESGQFLENAA